MLLLEDVTEVAFKAKILPVGRVPPVEKHRKPTREADCVRFITASCQRLYGNDSVFLFGESVCFQYLVHCSVLISCSAI
jgi:hypothetical protein